MIRVIIYGLGNIWKSNRKWIQDCFDVVGYSDHDERKSEFWPNFVNCSDLKEKEEDILVCASWKLWPYMVKSLIEEFGVSESRIRIWENELDLLSISKNKGGFLSLAQFGEDYVISRLLSDLGIALQDANYIELGTCNPLRHNNTVFLHRNGAKGLLVEANPDFIPGIRCLRKGSIILNRAVVGMDNKEEVLPFYIEEGGGMSSLDKEWIERCADKKIKKIEIINTININECFEYLDMPCRVLSVDVEGYDEIVLQDIDYEKYAPNIICAETGGNNKIIKMMKSKGYEYVFGNLTNDIWVKE